jgi:E3 ubiquitin-protein ligase UBR7
MDEEVTDMNEKRYGQNYWGRFCTCEVEYDPDKESGTMYQCMLGDVCGEDWFHDVCIVGIGPPQYVRKEEEKDDLRRKPVELAINRKTDALEEVASDAATGEANDAENGDRFRPESASSAKDKRNEENLIDGEQVIEKQLRLNNDPNFTTIASGSNQTLGTEAGADTKDENSDGEEDDDDEPPPGFPQEEFEYFICWSCVEANPWLKRYAGTPGFLPAVERIDSTITSTTVAVAKVIAASGEPSELSKPSAQASEPTIKGSLESSHKRKASESDQTHQSKRAKTPTLTVSTAVSKTSGPSSCTLPPPPPPPPSKHPISLFLTSDFRKHICRCPSCLVTTTLQKHPVLLEEEESYKPPPSPTVSTCSMLDRGEAALNGIDRVRALEGVMAFNQLKERVKAFLAPFARDGREVGEQDVRSYFEQLKESEGRA